MENLWTTFALSLQADSVWSVVFRGGVWLILVTIFAYGAAKGKDKTRIKSEAGFFLLFVVLTVIAIYLAFGFVPTVTAIEEPKVLMPTATFAMVHALYPLSKIASYFPQT